MKNWSALRSLSLVSKLSSARIPSSRFLIIREVSGHSLCALSTIPGSIIIGSLTGKSELVLSGSSTVVSIALSPATSISVLSV